MFMLVLLAASGWYLQCRSATDNCHKEEVEVSSQDQRHWPSGIVYYTTDPKFTSEQQDLINKAISHIEERTCITFIPRKSSSNSKLLGKTLFIMRGPSCSGLVGYRRYGSDLYLQSYCFRKLGTVVHELLHALGIRHEHQRWDRNYFIHINYTNIRARHVKNFVRRSRSISYITSAGLPYDYNSIMHYGPWAFAKDKTWKVVSPLCDCASIGQRLEMSPADVARVNRLYNCTQKYLGDDILKAVPFHQWKKYVTKLRRHEDRHRW